MRRNIRKISLCTIACLLFISAISPGQVYRFRNYGPESDLPGETVYTLNQDSNGYLWIGTADGLSRFDGFEFRKVFFPDTAKERYPTVCLKDKKGRLWFGCSDGTLFYSEGALLKNISISNTSGISSILEGSDGYIYAFAQRSSVFKVNPENPSDVINITIDSNLNMMSACFTGTGDILVGTPENLLICKIEGEKMVTVNTVDEFDYSTIMAIRQLKDCARFLIGTDGNGLFMLRLSADGNSLSRIEGHPDMETLSVKSFAEDSDNNIWVSTSGSGTYRLKFAGQCDSLKDVLILNKNAGLAGDNVSLVFQDSEENVWIGFNGDGLSMLATDSFMFTRPGNDENSNNLIYIGKLSDSYFLGTPKGFYNYDLEDSRAISFTSVTKLGVKNEISSYFIDNDNNVWIGTTGSGLFIRNKEGNISRFYSSGDTGADYITNINISGDNIWLSTLNGVNIISRLKKTLKLKYDINNGLSHNMINQILLTPDGSGYVATEADRLYRIIPDSGIVASYGVMYGTLLNEIKSLTVDGTGNIWAATQGNGIFEFQGDSVKSLNATNGILSNFAYSILADQENNIWIGHERGLSRYNPATGLIKVYETKFANGGSCNSNSMYESPDGKIFIGTTEGLIIYDRLKDRRKHLAPVNNINSIDINDVEYPYQSSFTLPYRKSYNVRINYTGIDLSDPEKVYFSTFMENYDTDWTKESSSREVTYNLRDGKYKFNLVSVNEDGLSEETPLSFEITIKPPVWRTWWFITLLVAFVSGLVFVIFRQREKAQKKVQAYLENQLEARTKVVMKQKAEIELQNIEITDSIFYAKRIQSSILPDINRLKEQFTDAFVMLFPRDIVSGDFYWFDKLDDDRFVLVCADSTGHGVPGAFMSMIGSTLLQDIVSRQRISRPSEILTLLDKQIFSTLNQNIEFGVSNDGMDVVVCEFSLKNRHLRFASAMRPVIIVMGGEVCYVKGNKSSVGGQTIIEKYFDDQEYYLSEGDSIYMFSDGLPDQFGGTDGKKLKVTRLKKLIAELSYLPLNEQEAAFLKFYHDWKGDYEQVDDILFMGVRI